MESNNIIRNFSRFYKFLSYVKKNNVKRKNTIKPKSLNVEKIVVSNLKKCDNNMILKLFTQLGKYSYCLDVFLHGSWADNTNNAYSDIDDLIILHKNKIKNKRDLKVIYKKLLRIDMNLCRIDPLQHHGHWIIEDDDLDLYDNSFMPIHVLENALVIQGNNFIRANVDKDLTTEGYKQNIINTCHGIIDLFSKLDQGNISSYELKGLIGCFVLMPSYIFQLKGVNYTKPEAIMESVKIYSQQSQQCIKWASECRMNWNLIIKSKRFRIFKMLPYLFNDPYMWRFFSKKISPKVSSIQLKKLCKNDLKKDFVDQFVKESLLYAE